MKFTYSYLLIYVGCDASVCTVMLINSSRMTLMPGYIDMLLTEIPLPKYSDVNASFVGLL